MSTIELMADADGHRWVDIDISNFKLTTHNSTQTVLSMSIINNITFEIWIFPHVKWYLSFLSIFIIFIDIYHFLVFIDKNGAKW